MPDIELIGPVVLFLLMMLVGLELTLADFRRVFKVPKAVIGGTLGQWILLPLMTWGLVEALDLAPAFGAGAILVAVSPGAGMSNIACAFARANIALSVTLTATASAFAVVTLPLISASVMGLFVDGVDGVEVPVLRLMRELMMSLLLPIALGMWLRSRNPKRADALAPRLQRIVFLAIGILIGVAYMMGGDTGGEDPFAGSSRAAVGAALWTLAAGGIGWTLAAVLGLTGDDRFTFLIEFGARNIAVAAIVALSGLNRLDLSLFSMLYGGVGYPIIILAVIARRRWKMRQDAVAAATEATP